jgi:2,4-dienoyl-CoA reductase (NADPH2)
MRQLAAGRLEPDEAWRLSSWQRRAVNAIVPRLQRWLTPARLQCLSRAWLPLGREVAIIGADLAAVELAEFLARRGRHVHLLDNGSKIIPEVGKKRRHEHMDRLDALRVTVNTGVRIVRIERHAVAIEAGGRERLVCADSIIVAGEPVAERRLADALADAGFAVHTVGDCNGLGLIVRAVRGAAEAAASLSTVHEADGAAEPQALARESVS